MLSLLTTRRFAPLFLCQFLAAFNDNFLKNALVALIVYAAVASRSGALVQLAGAIFIAPFFFLSGIGGEIADRFDKAVVARSVKLAELAATVVAAIGFGLALDPRPDHLARAVRRARGAVRAREVRHPSRSPQDVGAAVRQRADRGRDLSAILIGTTAGTKAAVEIANPWVVSVGLVLLLRSCMLGRGHVHSRYGKPRRRIAHQGTCSPLRGTSSRRCGPISAYGRQRSSPTGSGPSPPWSCR